MIRKNKKKIAALVTGLALAATAFAAYSARSQMIETYFYDDDGYWVGEYTVPCEGRAITWGVQTANYTTTTTNCDPEPPFSWD